MKPANLSKVIGAGALSLSLAILPAYLPVSAQSTNGGSNSGTTNVAPGASNDGTNGAATNGAAGTTTRAAASDATANNGNHGNGGYWGLLGLLGLFGLLGRGRGKDHATVYRDPAEEVRSSSGTSRY